MPHEPLSPEELDALRRFSTPSISNAIERFDVRPRHHGFTGPEIRCMFPEMPPIVGYASTAIVMAERPAAAGRGPAGGGGGGGLPSVPGPRGPGVHAIDPPPAHRS